MMLSMRTQPRRLRLILKEVVTLLDKATIILLQEALRRIIIDPKGLIKSLKWHLQEKLKPVYNKLILFLLPVEEPKTVKVGI